MKESKENTITKKCPLCVNISRVKCYLLAPDEIILFDWFVIKQSLFYNYKPFECSREQMGLETNIKRDRLTCIIKRFEAMELITISKTRNTATGGVAVFYKVNFKDIKKRLSELFDSKNKEYKNFVNYFNAQSEFEKMAEKKPISFITNMNEREVDELYKLLCRTWSERIELYNKNQERVKTATQLLINKTIKLGLWRLMERYTDETINCAFIAFADWCLENEKQDDILGKFTQYDDATDTMPYFDTSLNNFIKNYSKPSN